MKNEGYSTGKMITLLCASLFLLASGHEIMQAQAASSEIKGDHIQTDNGDLIIHPINHATFVMSWNGKTIYADPVGGGKMFDQFPRPDLLLITDIHGDHLDPNTDSAIVTDKTTIVAPQAVASKLAAKLKPQTTVLTNGETKTIAGMKIEAIPMYNLTPERLKFHTKGRGNGYVLTLGGKRIYISGDTEDIPEMRALKDIDVAFVCMNLPYTMDVEQAAKAVAEFKPKIVYPYHSRGSDVEKFKALVSQTPGIEVRLRDWYPPSKTAKP
jgi:L-ascorbate metabolism protein UlaG (beta-lactamase superfamily)